MKPSLANQGGQLIVEAVLIMILFVAVSAAVANYFKENEVLRQLISGPWQNLAGMLQNGVWAPAEVGATIHPNGHNRHVVVSGEDAK